MLRFESHVFVLCTILALLTFAAQTNAGDEEKENNHGDNKEISDSDDDYSSDSEKDWIATQEQKNELLLKQTPEDKKQFIEKYTSMMKRLKGKRAYLHIGTEKSLFKKIMRNTKFGILAIGNKLFELIISEETIFEDVYMQLMNATAEDILKRQLSVRFDNNPDNCIGSNKNWLYLLSKEIFNPSRKLFKYVDPNATNPQLEINPDSESKYNNLQHFKFVGRVFVLALLNERRIRVNLTPSFYESILNENIKMDNVEKQMSAFIKGLTDFIPLDELRKFNATELELLFCDTEQLDIDEWKKYTSYRSDDYDDEYKENNSIIEWFWEIIEGYNESERRKVLLFTTGTDALPVNGFLNDWVPFKILKKVPLTTLAVPHIRAFMPYKELMLPPYETKEELIDEMNKIIGK